MLTRAAGMDDSISLASGIGAETILSAVELPQNRMSFMVNDGQAKELSLLLAG